MSEDSPISDVSSPPITVENEPDVSVDTTVEKEPDVSSTIVESELDAPSATPEDPSTVSPSPDITTTDDTVVDTTPTTSVPDPISTPESDPIETPELSPDDITSILDEPKEQRYVSTEEVTGRGSLDLSKLAALSSLGRKGITIKKPTNIVTKKPERKLERKPTTQPTTTVYHSSSSSSGTVESAETEHKSSGLNIGQLSGLSKLTGNIRNNNLSNTATNKAQTPSYPKSTSTVAPIRKPPSRITTSEPPKHSTEQSEQNKSGSLNINSENLSLGFDILLNRKPPPKSSSSSSSNNNNNNSTANKKPYHPPPKSNTHLGEWEKHDHLLDPLINTQPSGPGKSGYSFSPTKGSITSPSPPPFTFTANKPSPQQHIFKPDERLIAFGNVIRTISSGLMLKNDMAKLYSIDFTKLWSEKFDRDLCLEVSNALTPTPVDVFGIEPADTEAQDIQIRKLFVQYESRSINAIKNLSIAGVTRSTYANVLPLNAKDQSELAIILSRDLPLLLDVRFDTTRSEEYEDQDPFWYYNRMMYYLANCGILSMTGFNNLRELLRIHHTRVPSGPAYIRDMIGFLSTIVMCQEFNRNTKSNYFDVGKGSLIDIICVYSSQAATISTLLQTPLKFTAKPFMDISDPRDVSNIFINPVAHWVSVVFLCGLMSEAKEDVNIRVIDIINGLKCDKYINRTVATAKALLTILLEEQEKVEKKSKSKKSKTGSITDQDIGKLAFTKTHLTYSLVDYYQSSFLTPMSIVTGIGSGVTKGGESNETQIKIEKYFFEQIETLSSSKYEILSYHLMKPPGTGADNAGSIFDPTFREGVRAIRRKHVGQGTTEGARHSMDSLLEESVKDMFRLCYISTMDDTESYSVDGIKEINEWIERISFTINMFMTYLEDANLGTDQKDWNLTPAEQILRLATFVSKDGNMSFEQQTPLEVILSTIPITPRYGLDKATRKGLQIVINLIGTQVVAPMMHIPTQTPYLVVLINLLIEGWESLRFVLPPGIPRNFLEQIRQLYIFTREWVTPEYKDGQFVRPDSDSIPVKDRRKSMDRATKHRVSSEGTSGADAIPETIDVPTTSVSKEMPYDYIAILIDKYASLIGLSADNENYGIHGVMKEYSSPILSYIIEETLYLIDKIVTQNKDEDDKSDKYKGITSARKDLIDQYQLRVATSSISLSNVPIKIKALHRELIYNLLCSNKDGNPVVPGVSVVDKLNGDFKKSCQNLVYSYAFTQNQGWSEAVMEFNKELKKLGATNVFSIDTNLVTSKQRETESISQQEDTFAKLSRDTSSPSDIISVDRGNTHNVEPTPEPSVPSAVHHSHSSDWASILHDIEKSTTESDVTKNLKRLESVVHSNMEPNDVETIREKLRSFMRRKSSASLSMETRNHITDVMAKISTI
jgi:hypothetical protein